MQHMNKSRNLGPRPSRKRIRLPKDAYLKPGVWYFVTVCCQNKKPLLQTPEQRTIVQEILQQTAITNRVELAAYTVMPNHVHFICSAGTQGLSGFVREFKSRTALEFRRRFQAKSPWQPRFFDHKLRTEESLKKKCQYVWLNPVRKRLVLEPNEYAWSGTLLTG